MRLTTKKSIGKFNVPVFVGILIIHVLGLVALLSMLASAYSWYAEYFEIFNPSWVETLSRFFTTNGFLIFLFFYWVTGGLGVTLCFHRQLTHYSFETARWLKYILTLFGTLSFQGGVIKWVAVHRIHHRHSDKEGDPHSPTHGLHWSHYIWFMFDQVSDKEIEQHSTDLRDDPGMVLIDRYFWVPQVLVTMLLFGFGLWWNGLITAFSWVLWGIGFRTTFTYHITWLVNSGCHLWGYKNFKTGDESRNNWWIALLSFGEGWHENHHAEQYSAAHGNRHWYEFDITYWTILTMKALGLVKKIREPKRQLGT